MNCSSSKTLQQCLQQRRRNVSLQQLYNKGNSLEMRVVGRQTDKLLPLNSCTI